MSSLTREKLVELRRRAEACPMPDNDPRVLSEWYEFGNLTERHSPIAPIDAAFIVVASPDVVLGLLDQLEAVRTAAQTGTPTNPHAWADGYAEAMSHILGVLDNTDL